MKKGSGLQYCPHTIYKGSRLLLFVLASSSKSHFASVFQNAVDGKEENL